MNKVIINDTEHESPYNYSKYEFVTENSVDIKDSFIEYAESVINRPANQISLNELLNDIDMALKIELSIFEYSLIYCHNNHFDNKFIKSIYDDKIHNILINIKKTPGIDNNTFKSQLNKNNINPPYVAFMSPAQIHPDKWEYYVKKKEFKEQRENNLTYSDAYKCFKCGESKCKISQAQTRGADEPMTTFVTCLVCYKTFKFC